MKYRIKEVNNSDRGGIKYYPQYKENFLSCWKTLQEQTNQNWIFPEYKSEYDNLEEANYSIFKHKRDNKKPIIITKYLFKNTKGEKL